MYVCMAGSVVVVCQLDRTMQLYLYSTVSNSVGRSLSILSMPQVDGAGLGTSNRSDHRASTYIHTMMVRVVQSFFIHSVLRRE